MSVYTAGPAEEYAVLQPSGELYSDAKLAAEWALLEAGSGADCPQLVILRLASIYGPGAQRWTEQPLSLARRRALSVPGAANFTFPYLYIENMVDAVTPAASKDAAGVYNIYDGVTTYADFMGRYARMAGAHLGVIPTLLLKAVAVVNQALGWLVGRYPANNPRALQALLRGVDCPPAAEKAGLELGWHPRISLDEGMAAIENRNGFRKPKKDQNPWQENKDWGG
jgi:nucleoside-diphosphate-sugar epimerase